MKAQSRLKLPKTALSAAILVGLGIYGTPNVLANSPMNAVEISPVQPMVFAAVEPLPEEAAPHSGLPITLRSASLTEFADHTRIRLVLEQVVEDVEISTNEVDGSTSVVIDLPVNMQRLETIHLDDNSRIGSISTAFDGKMGRLVLDLSGPFSARTQAHPSGVDILISGPALQKNRTISMLRETGMSADMRSMIDALDSSVVIRPEPTLSTWRTYLDSEGAEIVELGFDSDQIEMLTQRLASGETRFMFKHGVLPQDALGQLSLQGQRYFDRALIEQGEQNLTLTFTPKDAVFRVSQDANLVRVALREKVKLRHLASLTTTVNDAVGEVGVKPAEFPSHVESALPVYSGEPITLNFKDTDVHTVMSVFADFTDLNLVLTEGVKGGVTMNLKNVPWDQAFEVVLKAKGLVARQTGNVMLISTANEATALAKEVRSTISKDDMEPVVGRTFHIRYQKAGYLLDLLKQEGANFLSERGSALADEATGKVFVEDTPSRLKKIAFFFDELDRPLKQVLIEAKVVLVDKSASEELGIKLNMASQVFNGELTDAASGLSDVGGKLELDTSSVGPANFGYTLLDLNGTQFLRARLKALEENLLVKTVSNPRVVTTNKQEALIEQGTRIPYQAATSSGATETQFQDANLKLQVTPQIGPDGSILLDVDVSKDSVGEVTNNGLAINTRHVRTKVSVMTGGTVVLGGIFEDERGKQESKVPVLGDIPVLGGLFRSKLNNNNERELLIFITPVIIDES